MIEIKFLKNENKAIAEYNSKLIGECQFVVENNTWNIIHTIVSKEYQGQKIAQNLVECIIKEAKNDGKKLIADCSYANYVIKNKV